MDDETTEVEMLIPIRLRILNLNDDHRPPTDQKYVVSNKVMY